MPYQIAKPKTAEAREEHYNDVASIFFLNLFQVKSTFSINVALC